MNAGPLRGPAGFGAVHVVVPEGICDPARPSGGNVYDRRVSRGLAGLGWSVWVREVPGCWPSPDAAALAALAAAVSDVADGGVALVDGLIASTAPRVLVPEAARIALVVLVHLPLGAAATVDEPPGAHAREGAVLAAAAAVVTTSGWTRDRLVSRYPLPRDRVHVAQPGADPAEPATATTDGGRLLCVAAVTPLKGQDVLVAALATITDLDWSCVCVGPVDRDDAFADRIGREVKTTGLMDRLQLTGPLHGADLEQAYAARDLLVVASRMETYGMAVTEALARGIPVLATDVGGIREALGTAADGSVPGLLVPPDSPDALAAALRRWLSEPGLRRRLQASAAERRRHLRTWTDASSDISQVLMAVSA
ncbi:glycosyltransferase family 4 protein [Nakamurella sp. GG22]